MSASKFKLIFTGIIAFIITIVCIRLFSCNNDNSSKPVIIDNTAQLRKDFNRQIAAYNNKVDSLGQINQKLRSQAVSTQSAILKVKQENRSLKQTINDLLTIHYTATDTTTILQNCDSLAVTLQEVVAFNNKKDSIYDNFIGNLQSQLTIQDSVIDLQHFENDSLQNTYHRLLDQHTALIAENVEQRKAIKKQKRGKGLLGVVAAVAAGLFTWHALK
jgi:hypothetical protein